MIFGKKRKQKGIIRQDIAHYAVSRLPIPISEKTIESHLKNGAKLYFVIDSLFFDDHDIDHALEYLLNAQKLGAAPSQIVLTIISERNPTWAYNLISNWHNHGGVNISVTNEEELHTILREEDSMQTEGILPFSSQQMFVSLLPHMNIIIALSMIESFSVIGSLQALLSKQYPKFNEDTRRFLELSDNWDFTFPLVDEIE